MKKNQTEYQRNKKKQNELFLNVLQTNIDILTLTGFNQDFDPTEYRYENTFFGIKRSCKSLF